MNMLSKKEILDQERLSWLLVLFGILFFCFDHHILIFCESLFEATTMTRVVYVLFIIFASEVICDRHSTLFADDAPFSCLLLFLSGIVSLFVTLSLGFMTRMSSSLGWLPRQKSLSFSVTFFQMTMIQILSLRSSEKMKEQQKSSNDLFMQKQRNLLSSCHFTWSWLSFEQKGLRWWRSKCKMRDEEHFLFDSHLGFNASPLFVSLVSKSRIPFLMNVHKCKYVYLMTWRKTSKMKDNLMNSLCQHEICRSLYIDFSFFLFVSVSSHIRLPFPFDEWESWFKTKAFNKCL